MSENIVTKQVARQNPVSVQAPLRPASSVSTQTAQTQNLNLSNIKPVKVKAKPLTVKTATAGMKSEVATQHLKNAQHHILQGNTTQNK